MGDDLKLALLREAADPSRLRILLALSAAPKTVGEIVEATGLKQPNVSNHLARLRRCDVVRATRSGKHVSYSISSPALAEDIRAYESRKPAIEADLEEGCVPRFVRWALAGDEASCTSFVDQILAAGTPVMQLYRELFIPSLERIGDQWQQGKIDEAQEHLASAMIELLMYRAMHVTSKPPATRGTAVVGCAEGSWHSLGLRMISDAMRLSGWKVLYLGASVPTKAFLRLAEEHEPAVVLVSCTLPQAQTACLALIEQLDNGPWTLVVGGRFEKELQEEVEKAGADYVCSSLDQFVDSVLPALNQGGK